MHRFVLQLPFLFIGLWSLSPQIGVATVLSSQKVSPPQLRWLKSRKELKAVRLLDTKIRVTSQTTKQVMIELRFSIQKSVIINSSATPSQPAAAGQEIVLHFQDQGLSVEHSVQFIGLSGDEERLRFVVDWPLPPAPTPTLTPAPIAAPTVMPPALVGTANSLYAKGGKGGHFVCKLSPGAQNEIIGLKMYFPGEPNGLSLLSGEEQAKFEFVDYELFETPNQFSVKISKVNGIATDYFTQKPFDAEINWDGKQKVSMLALSKNPEIHFAITKCAPQHTDRVYITNLETEINYSLPDEIVLKTFGPPLVRSKGLAPEVQTSTKGEYRSRIVRDQNSRLQTFEVTSKSGVVSRARLIETGRFQALATGAILRRSSGWAARTFGRLRYAIENAYFSSEPWAHRRWLAYSQWMNTHSLGSGGAFQALQDIRLGLDYRFTSGIDGINGGYSIGVAAASIKSAAYDKISPVLRLGWDIPLRGAWGPEGFGVPILGTPSMLKLGTGASGVGNLYEFDATIHWAKSLQFSWLLGVEIAKYKLEATTIDEQTLMSFSFGALLNF